MRRLRARIAAWLPLAALLPPLLAMALLTARLGVTVPTVEQLQYVPSLKAVFLDGHAGWQELFWQQPTSDHIAFFPLLGLLAWAPLSGWNVGAELALTPLYALLSSLMLLRFARRLGTFREPWRFTGLAMAVGLLMFSGRHWSAWTWSMSSLFSFTPMCCLAALTLLSRERAGPRSFWAAAGICAVATFSFGNGAATWIAALPLLSLKLRTRGERKWFWIWLAVAAACVALYMARYRYPGTVPLLDLSLYGSWVYTSYFFMVLWGQPLVADVVTAEAVGRFLLMLGVLLVCQLPRKGPHAKTSMALCGAFVFSLVSGLLIARSRVGLGMAYALESRYGPVMAVGLAVIVILLLQRMNRTWTALVVSGLLLLWVTALPAEVTRAQWRHRYFSQGKICLESYRIASDECLGFLYFGYGAYVRQQADVLDRLGYLPRFEPPADLEWTDAEAAPGAFERVTRAGPGLPWVAEGWASPPDCAADTRVLVTAGPERRLIGVAAAVLSHPRAAVAREGCADAGWSLTLHPEQTRGTNPADMEAWVYDAAAGRAVRLPKP